MRTLSATLTATQKAASARPYVTLTAHRKLWGVERLQFTRLYTGAEAQAVHGACIITRGGIPTNTIYLTRARISGGQIYTQVKTDPDDLTDFSTGWTATGYATATLAICGSPDVVSPEMSMFYFDGASLEIRQRVSTDYGATWGAPVVVDTLGAGATLAGLAADYSNNDNLVLFWVRSDGYRDRIFWSYKASGGAWSSPASSALVSSGITIQHIGCCARHDSAANNGKWPVIITGTDASSNPTVWSTQFRWTSQDFATIRQIDAAPSGSSFTFSRPFIQDPDDTPRTFYLELFSGTTAYNRPHWTYMHPSTSYEDNFYLEPQPFNHDCTHGLAIAYDEDYVWLSEPRGVWRAPRELASLALTGDILRVKEEIEPFGGRLTVELDNFDGAYATPGTGTIEALNVGSELRLSLGFNPTGAGSPYYEVSESGRYQVQSIEHISAGGKATLIVAADSMWEALGRQKASRQLRWNATPADDILDILQSIFARIGVKLAAASSSSTMTGYQPDFTVYPGQSLLSAVKALLSFVPDVIRPDGSGAEAINPQDSDSSTYSYNAQPSTAAHHAVIEGRYLTRSAGITRLRAEGRNAGSPIIGDSFDWTSQALLYDRYRHVFDLNIDTAAEATERGDAVMRDTAIAATAGEIVIPVNCGQELYDVIDLTDSRAGLSAAKRRVTGIQTKYDTRKPTYSQVLGLGAA